MDAPNEHYHRLVERTPDGIILSQRSRIVFANEAAARIWEAPAHSIEGMTLGDLFGRDARALERVRLAEPRPIDATITGIGGTQVDVEISVARLDEPDSEGELLALTVRDVTDRKRSEAAVRESEERLRLAFAGAQEGVWDWDLETGDVVYSARWKQMLGYDEDDPAIEPHVGAWERLLHPEDKLRADQVYGTVARGERMYEGEFRLRHKAGHYIHVLSRGFPVRRDPNGPIVRIVGTHFDLTERKRAEAALRESEERLTLAFAGAQEGVWDWNLETGAVVYSARWKQMLGYDPEDDTIEPNVSAWERLLHPDDQPRAQAVSDSVARGAHTYEGEFRLRHKQGHFIHVLSRGFPVRREPGGPVVRIVGTHFDLTERKRAETERARTELLSRLVFAQEDERRRIAREMHDQFGEQLTALSRAIGRLKASCADPGLAGQVAGLEAIAQRIDRDVDQLVWELRPTALDDLGLRAALTNYVQDWSKRVNISVDLHTTGLLDSRLSSEAETTLYRIAQEALTNIAKHAQATSVDVILERQGDSVLLIIEDDGVGFEADDTVRTEHGFGLLGMQERAALVGASLQIESTPGHGTTVLLRMLANPSATADHA